MARGSPRRQIRAFACCPTGGTGLNHVPLAAPGAEVSQARIRPGRLCSACTSGLLSSGLVLLNDAGRNAPPGADRDALGLRPRPDAPAAIPARCGPPAPAALSPPGLAGM